ncbi:MAG TPA: xylulokinase [Solirubrobacteraceae bacterium]|nr:xylulokinase [Solirubrobacteraceae bacterium]
MSAFGLDVGTSAVKGLALDAQGRVLAAAEASYPLHTPRPGWAEQDPEDWWRAASSVLAQLRTQAGPPQGIGLSGQMHGLVALDAGERVLRPAILWNDQRTGAECREIEQTLGLERLIALTGNRALPGFTAPKLLWLRRNEPEVFARIARIALPKDYVRLRLCGEHATDVVDASGTLLLDVAARRWSEEVLEALALERAWLPRALESPQVSGLTAEGVPVAAGAGDQAAGALGVGVDRAGGDGILSVVLGTSGVVFAALERFVADPQARLHIFCHALPGSWHAMGVMLSAAGSLSWLQAIVGGEYNELTAEAGRWPATTEGLLFLPYLAGERTPHADPDARGAYVGLGLRHDRGALVRALLEGVAFGLRDSLDLIRALGERPALARVSGGGARSELWLQIVASVLELPLQRVAVQDAAAFGAALLGGVAGGVWPDVPAAIAATVHPREQIEPVAEWIEPYRAAHERYRALYPALRACR